MLSKEKMDTVIDSFESYLSKNIVLMGNESYADISVITKEGNQKAYPSIILNGPYYLEVVVVFTKNDLSNMMSGNVNSIIEKRVLEEMIPINPYELSQSMALEKLGFQKYRDVSGRDFKVDSLYVTLMINELRNRE